MNSTINQSKLYGITDEHLLPGEKLFTGVEAALLGGCKWIQYRNKSTDSKQRYLEAGRLLELCRQYSAFLIVNDDPALAKKINADGVHLGQSDCTPLVARKLLGDQKIIGVTCHNQLDLARKAIEDSANYIAFGRFYASMTKPDAQATPIEIIQQARDMFREVPIAVIGGINRSNCLPLLNAGANLIAVGNSLFGAKDIRDEAEKLSQLFK